MSMVLLLLTLIALAPLVLLVGHGGRRLARPGSFAEDAYTGPGGRVGLVVPVKGAPQGLRDCLQALLAQDHPRHVVAFVVEETADPAVAVINELLQQATQQGRAHGRLVIAGKAESCGQKNWNQLAGIAALAETGGVDILAFCDSTHMPRPDWLRNLVAPIDAGRSEAATAYHHVLPQSRGLATMGRTVSVLALYMMQEIPAVTQPWGGSMAIRRSTFERLDVPALWTRNVVDDVSLARRLDDAGLRAVPVLGAQMETHLQGESFRGWRVWLERQWLYLKFIYPGSWAAVGVVLALQTLLLPLAVWNVLAGLAGAAGAGAAACGWLYLLALLALGLKARDCHPAPGGRLSWLAGFFATLPMAAWCHLRTLFQEGITWGGVAYSVGRGGQVTALRRD